MTTPKPQADLLSLGHFIHGKQVPGNAGARRGDVFNPTLGALRGTVALASKAETEAAIASAHAAFPDWAATSPLTRARVMFRFKELVEKHMDELAMLVSSEHGKVL